MRLKIFIFFFITCVLLGQAPKYFHGVQTHLGQVARPLSDTVWMKQVLDSIQKAGIKVIRDECLWSELEKTRGVYEFPESIDFFVKAAKDRGIEVLFILDYNNAIYSGTHAGAGITTDSNRAAFVNYCKAMVNHFLPMGVKFYEIWNEPNIPTFWSPTPNADDYVKLLQAVYPALKQIDSTITIIGCATSPAEGDPAPFIMWRTYIQEVWTKGGGNYLDGISFHLYRVEKTPENFIFTDLANLVSIIGNTKPVYITEIGYHTASVWPNLTIQKQALYISKLYIMGRGFNQLKSIVYYDFKNDGTNAADPEHNFGIMNYDLSPKPAYNAYKNVINNLADANYVNYVKIGDSYRYNFQKGDTSCNVIFNSTSTLVTKTEQFSKNVLLFRSLFGDEYYVYDRDKFYQVTYQEEPQFIFNLNNLLNINKLEILNRIDTLVAGQRINLKLIGKTEDDKIIYIDSLAVQWSFSNNVARVDSNGVLTALRAGSGDIIFTFNNQTFTKTITVLESFNYLEIENFNSMEKLFTSYFQMLPNTSVAIVDSNYTTATKSLLINYEFKYEGIDRHRVIFDCDYPLFGEPDSILIDVYNNNNGHVVEFTIEDADGEIFKTNTSMIQAKYGWLTAKAKLTSFGSKFTFPVRLKRILVYCVKSGAIKDSIYSGKILIDNVRFHNPIVVGVRSCGTEITYNFSLSQNYPNPFNPKTTIEYEIPTPPNSSPLIKGEDGRGSVTLKIYDILGREMETLVNEPQTVGKYAVEWDASRYTSGIYFYEMRVGEFRDIKKMILIK